MDAVIKIQNVMPVMPKAAVPEIAQKTGDPVPPGGKDLPPPPENQSIESAVRQINSYLADSRRSLNFQVHEASGRTIVRVINPETDEVIRQIPSEEVLKLAAAMKSQGLQLVDELA